MFLICGLMHCGRARDRLSYRCVCVCVQAIARSQSHDSDHICGCQSKMVFGDPAANCVQCWLVLVFSFPAPECPFAVFLLVADRDCPLFQQEMLSLSLTSHKCMAIDQLKIDWKRRIIIILSLENRLEPPIASQNTLSMFAHTTRHTVKHYLGIEHNINANKM